MKEYQRKIPVIDLQNEVLVSSINDSPVLLTGAKNFLEHGVLLIENAFDRHYIQQVHDEFVATYRHYFEDTDYKDALSVGDKRTMITLRLQGIFNSPEFYASAKAVQLVRFLLGADSILFGMGAVVSLPGAAAQHNHRDAPNIYQHKYFASDDLGWIEKAPPYAVTMGIPLIPLDEITGNTRFWPGTHKITIADNDPGLGEGLDFKADIGSCILFDYRVIHAGLPNNSDRVRPLIYNVYSKPWFRDHINYKNQDPVSATIEELMKIPPAYSHLFEWGFSTEQRLAIEEMRASISQEKKPLSRNEPCFCGSGKRYKHCHGIG